MHRVSYILHNVAVRAPVCYVHNWESDVMASAKTLITPFDHDKVIDLPY
jgi:hypothetical protein